MNKEDFRILKEICGLEDKLTHKEVEINSEKRRITKIEEMRSNRQEESSKLESELQRLEKRSEEIDQNLSNIHTQITQSLNAIDNAISEKQLESAQSQLNQQKLKVEELESSAFETLENIEEIIEKMNDAKTFLEGSLKTIEEITNEVDRNIHPINEEISILKERILNLKGQLPTDVISKLEKLIDKNLKHGPLTKIENGACYICRFDINTIDRDKVEKALQLKSCSSCSRIFIPNSTLY